jgi:hypothetical protein
MITSFEELQPAEDQEDVYLPSAERIARMCRAYQQSWSDRERMKRSYLKPRRWTAPDVSVSMDFNHAIDE